jgi:7-cyano-7-deazaguanine reductase
MLFGMKEILLGKPTVYVNTYTPELLHPIPRTLGRNQIGLGENLPFDGVDLWTGFELSWLNLKGKPVIALADFAFPCRSPFLVESKSFKLYLNSFNQTKFASMEDVQAILAKDLSEAAGSEVQVTLFSHAAPVPIDDFKGICLDDLDIETDTYAVDPSFLTTLPEIVDRTYTTHLLKSNCMATGQPDWGSLMVRSVGPKIDPVGLLKYLISYRNHIGFGEHCIEKIYCDILKYCKPAKLTVYARYTRRGGLDINPFRSNFEQPPTNYRLSRQ